MGRGWGKNEFVVAHTGITGMGKRRAIKKAMKKGYTVHSEGTTTVTFKKVR